MEITFKLPALILFGLIILALVEAIYFLAKDHGDKDRTVPINQSQLLFESLKGVGVSGHFHTIHGAGHGRPGFDAPEIETMVVAFFERHLKSKSPPLGSPDASTSESTATEGSAR